VLNNQINDALVRTKSITNIALVWLDTLKASTPIPVAGGNSKEVSGFSRDCQYTYIYESGKFRAECILTNDNNRNRQILKIAAFDGVTNFIYSGDERFLSMGTNSPDFGAEHSPFNPLTLPFLFLSPASDECRECPLRFDRLVANLQPIQIPPLDAIETNGIWRVSFKGKVYGHADTTWILTLDPKNSSYTPNRIDSLVPGEHYSMVFFLSDYLNLNGCQIPRQVKYQMFNYPLSGNPKELFVGSISILSYSLNETHDPSLFRLEKESKKAEIVWDADRHKPIVELAKYNQSRKTLSIAKTLLISLILISGVVICFFWLASKKVSNVKGQ